MLFEVGHVRTHQMRTNGDCQRSVSKYTNKHAKSTTPFNKNSETPVNNAQKSNTNKTNSFLGLLDLALCSQRLPKLAFCCVLGSLGSVADSPATLLLSDDRGVQAWLRGGVSVLILTLPHDCATSQVRAMSSICNNVCLQDAVSFNDDRV